MNLFAGIPSGAIEVDDESSNSTFRLPIHINIAIDHPYHVRGEVIAADVPLLPLKVIAPKILQYLTTDGAQMILPRSEAVDHNLLLNMIDLIVDLHRSGEDFKTDVDELSQDPVKLIKLHIMLEIFGLSHQAQLLMDLLWEVFRIHTLTLTDVFWIWGALHPPRSMKWVPESTDTYIRIVTWNLLSSDAELKLHPEVRTFFLEEEAKPYHLTCLLKQHYLEYGLGRAPHASPRKRRDTKTERTEAMASLCSLPNPTSTFVSAHKPIFPARWLSPQEPKEQSPSVILGPIFPDDKWDGKDKKVKEMAAEREELVSLRRLQAVFDSDYDLSRFIGPEHLGY